MSLDAAWVDLRQSFEPGMGYVALSRVRSSAGLSLAGFNQMALRVDEEVLEFDQKLKVESAKHAAEAAAKNLKARQFLPAKPAKKKPDTVLATREMLEKNIPLAEIAKIRNLTLGTILTHCEKIKAKFPDFDFSNLAKEIPAPKMEKIKSALINFKNENGAYPLSPAMEILDGAATYEDLRLVRLLL